MRKLSPHHWCAGALTFGMLLMLAGCPTPDKATDTTTLIDTTTPPITASPVYLVGGVGTGSEQTSTYPCYWKNGTYNALQTPTDEREGAYQGNAYAAVVSGGSVYITGNVKNGEYGDAIPCYWKDGAYTALAMSTLTLLENGEVWTVAVSNGLPYLAGDLTDFDGDYLPCYWANGECNLLSLSGGEVSYRNGSAYGLGMNGGTPYICGIVEDSDRIEKPSLWSDGVLEILDTDQYSAGDANALAIFGNSVIVAGAVYSRSEETGSIPCCWTGGTYNPLEYPDGGGGYATAMTVSGGSVYIAGYVWSVDSQSESQSTSYNPCYWKDGLRTDLPSVDSSSSPSIWAIVVSNGVVCVGGTSNNTPYAWTDGTYAALPLPGEASQGWVNGGARSLKAAKMK